MKVKSKWAIFLLICSAMVIFMTGGARAGINEVKEAFVKGGSSDADGAAAGPEDLSRRGAAGSAVSRPDDKVFGEKLKKLLEEIKQERPDIDSIPVAIVKSTDESAIENKTIEFARIKKNHIFAAMFKKAHNEFTAGNFENSFDIFGEIFAEFNENSKALYFMTLCRQAQGNIADAVELAGELLAILKERNANQKLRQELDTVLENFSDASRPELTPEQKKALNEKIDAINDKIKSLYPAIANIPENTGKPEEEKNELIDKLNRADRSLYRVRLEMLNAALELYKKGQYEKAYEAFEKVHQLYPANLRALYYMALSSKKLGKPDESAKMLAKIFSIIENRRDIKAAASDIKDEIESEENKGNDENKNKNDDGNDDENDAIIAGGDTIKVITYNIAKGQGRANNGAIFVGMKFLDEVARLLKKENADLIGMQEVDNNRFTTKGVNQADYIAEKLDMFHFWHEASARGPKENINEHGNAVLSKYKILKKEYFEFKTHGDPSARAAISETRGLSCALLEIDGVKVYFISTHFGFPEYARIGQAKELVEYIKKLDGPVILTGDFNTRYSEKSRSYRIINAVLDNTYDKAKVKGPTPRGGRGPAPPNTFIDFVFVTPGYFSCESICRGGNEYDAASDHKPVITVLKLKKKN
ncbi:MAG TPA: endonuclease/exonuclease/phosphatase family protein [Candidatus Wallbacteria bacterium]|nr:endonuclease/exonuclease/phosphatase family protein [Candidatus Wallbacteria bacterium]